MTMNFPYITTICYLINEKGEVLLQKKSRGFGEGKWNGPGGKIDPGETPEEGIIREVHEETGIRINSMIKKAEHEFIFPHEPESNNYTHIYISFDYEGEEEDKGEGELRWYKIDEIPLDKMWDDDQYWLKDVLSGKELNIRFYFDQNNKVEKFENIK
ncbi:8-oxo-dGTP diphosphatase [Patescibacteria group bacterium]